MASDVVAVRLHLPHARVLGVLTDFPGELVVEVESMVCRLRCAQCGSSAPGFMTAAPRRSGTCRCRAGR